MIDFRAKHERILESFLQTIPGIEQEINQIYGRIKISGQDITINLLEDPPKLPNLPGNEKHQKRMVKFFQELDQKSASSHTAAVWLESEERLIMIPAVGLLDEMANSLGGTIHLSDETTPHTHVEINSSEHPDDPEGLRFGLYRHYVFSS